MTSNKNKQQDAKNNADQTDDLKTCEETIKQDQNTSIKSYLVTNDDDDDETK